MVWNNEIIENPILCTSLDGKRIFKYYNPVLNAYKIKKVIFNYPATIVIWADGTKTVVKIHEAYNFYGYNTPDYFDKEKGILLCMMKKIYGEGYYKQLKKWCE